MDKKSVGSSAGILVLLAILFHPFGGSETDKRNGQKESPGMPDLAASAANKGTKELSPVLQGPWSSTQQYFHHEPTGERESLMVCIQRPDGCSASVIEDLYALSSHRSDVHAIIATVPDPLHTRMSLEVDRFLDAIQQAAFDSGFELATQWLPWTVKAAAEKVGASSGNMDKSFDWERLPGLLLFRHHFFENANAGRTVDPFGPDSLLLVFVVGETPTSGINGYQFDMANASIKALCGNSSDHSLYIAGPNFSGSFASMAELLKEYGAGWDRIEVRAGSATNRRFADQMLTELKAQFAMTGGSSHAKPAISFYGSLPPNSVFHSQFAQLVHKLHIDDSQAAEILETETGFAAVETDHLAFPILRYPRDIAQLRNTYNDAAFASSAGQTSTASPPSVSFSLKDTQAGEDDFPTFSTSHTPLSQDAVLEQISERIKQNHIRLVSLSASNVFDALFLASYLAQNCPDTRVVLPSADLIFTEEAIAGKLSGLMAISPFPLFPQATPLNNSLSGKDVTTFASSDQVAEFDAVLSLVGAMGGEVANAVAKHVQRYGPSVVEDDPSSSWILILSSRGWMPIDLFPSDDLQNRGWLSSFATSTSSVGDALAGLRAGGSLWLTLCAGVAFLTGFVCYRVWHLKRHPEERVWSSFCMEDPDPNSAPQPVVGGLRVLRSRYFCMTACFSNLAVANALLLCPMLTTDLRRGFHYWAVLVLLCAAFGWAAMTSVLLVKRWVPQSVRSGESTAVNIGLQFIAGGTIAAWCYCCFFNQVAAGMFKFRVLALPSGVCPLWPLLFSTLGLFGMAFFQLRRFTWCARRQPYLDTSLFDSLLENEFTQTKKRLETSLMGATGGCVWEAIGQRCGRAAERLAMFGWPFILLLIVALVLGKSLYSFEPWPFTYTVEGLFAILAVYVLSNLFRFFHCWRILRAFLVNLNSVLLGRFLHPVSEFSVGSGPIWVRDVKLMSLSTVVNGYIALYNLERLKRTALRWGASLYRDALKEFLLTSDGVDGRKRFVEAYRKLRYRADQSSKEMGEKILAEYWKTHSLEFVAVGDSDDTPKAAPAPALGTLKPPFDPGKTIFSTPWTAERLELIATHQAQDAAATSQRAYSARVGFGGESTTSAESDNLASTSSWTVHRLELVADGKPDTQVEPAEPTKEEYELASRYVALHYSTYIGYVLHQLQNLLVCSTLCFVVIVLGLNSFTFQAPQTLFHVAAASLVLVGTFIVIVLAQMERDPILSRLSGTKEGELGKDFYIRVLSFGAAPILTVLGTEFPSIARYVSSWIEPVTSGLH